jgi:thymidylate kinase
MFLAVEGIDGVGKTTVSRKLRDRLAVEFPDKEVVFSRAPEGPIRDLLLNRISYIDAKSEVLLFIAGHRWLLSNNVFPALKRGAIVVQDRFTDTTVAYQGAGRQLDTAWVYARVQEDITHGFEEKDLREQLSPRYAYRMVHQGVQPDHTLYVTAPQSVSEQRIIKRGNLDFMDAAGQEFRIRVARQMRIQKNMHDTEYLQGHSPMVVSEMSNAHSIEALDQAIEDWITEHKASITAHMVDMGLPGNPFYGEDGHAILQDQRERS